MTKLIKLQKLLENFFFSTLVDHGIKEVQYIQKSMITFPLKLN